jgi:hypothetical protein
MIRPPRWLVVVGPVDMQAFSVIGIFLMATLWNVLAGGGHSRATLLCSPWMSSWIYRVPAANFLRPEGFAWPARGCRLIDPLRLTSFCSLSLNVTNVVAASLNASFLFVHCFVGA